MRISVLTDDSPLIKNTLSVMDRVLRAKTGNGVQEVSQRPELVLALDESLPAEAYAIRDQPTGVAVSGGSDRGILYGVGRFLRDLHPGDAAAAAAWRPGSWRGISAPETAARGIYFATHFWNYYDEAPLPEVKTYLEDLALWGCNGLKVWFDMHHFNGITEPAAQAKITRLRQIMQYAAGMGMDLWLTGLCNEGYNSSPEHLRADWTSGHDGYRSDLVGHYHRELCPHKPGAMELMMKWRAEVLDAFSDLNLKYVSMSSYDQGGCTCSDCAPWGVNGLLEVGREYSRLAGAKNPGVEFIMSTWRFDCFIDGEWSGLHRAFARRPDWVDILSIDLSDLKHVIPQAPGGLKVFCMPEISMHGMLPWGGYGANPMPSRIKKFWDQAAAHVQGSYPYSEGIYEDMNKVIALQLQWNSSLEPAAIITDYAGCYFSAEVAADLCRAVRIMERNLGHCAYIRQHDKRFSTYRGPLLEFKPGRPWTLEHHTGKPLEQAEECYKLLQCAGAGLPAEVAASWRWRILVLRAAIDVELANTRTDTEVVQACCRELTDIYHAHRCEKPCVVPPLAARYQEMFRKPIELWL